MAGALCRGLFRFQTSLHLRNGLAGNVWGRAQQAAATAPQRAPEVYTKPPPQPKEKKPGQLTPKQLEQFFDKGFLIIPSYFTKEEMEPVKEAVNECVEMLAEKLYRGGKIQDKCEKAGFYERLILLDQQFNGASVLFHKLGYFPVGFQNLWTNERLLNMVEQLIGPDIAGHPVWNLRTKTPRNEQATVPWHQDNAYLDSRALYTLMPTAWIPLIDANKENGCMQIISEGHKPGFTATHTCCAGGTWYVELDGQEMEKMLGADYEKNIVTCEVPFGGMVLLNNCIPHRSLENFSNKTRWSVDLRWQDPKKPTGFYDLKASVPMRKSDDPNYKVDWTDFAVVDRNKLQAEHALSADIVPDDEFDTNIHGPWMTRWDIVHHNKHTKTLTDGGSSWHSHKPGDKA